MHKKTAEIIQELEQGTPVRILTQKYNKTRSAIYKLASRHNIKIPEPPRLSEEEKRENKRKTDARQYEKKVSRKLLERPDIPMPKLPLMAAKRRGIAAFNNAWVFSQGSRLEKPDRKIKTTIRYSS